MHALLQMHAGTAKHHCLQQSTVLNLLSTAQDRVLVAVISAYPAGSDAQCFAIPGHCKVQMY